jgi:MFS family permease
MIASRKKEMILIIVGLSASVVGAFGPMLSPGFVEIAMDLNISINALSQATAWLILTIGLSLFVANPLANIYGKRPIYIAAIAIMFATSVWGAVATQYDSFLASRIIPGVGMAPYESLFSAPLATCISSTNEQLASKFGTSFSSSEFRVAL